jgi:glucose/arabinose dehydrogenase
MLAPVAAAVLLAGCVSADSPAASPRGSLLPSSTATASATTAPTGTAASAVPASRRPPAAGPKTPSTLVSGLEAPWGLAFLPDGSALVSERDTARVHQVFPDGRRRRVATVPGVAPGGEGGLLGLAVARSYVSDRWVYAYVTTSGDNRVVRFRLTAPNQQQVLLSGIPKSGVHNGGRLAFGPDGMLYVGTGDAGDTRRAQDKRSLGGKILRLKPTGGAAAGNPFNSPIWTLGHRNVQGLAFDPQGRLWGVEFGQNAFDEVNLIVKGGNYGWPAVEGKGTGGGRFVSPQVTWRTSQASPSGAAYGGGALHVAALRGQRLYKVPLNGGRAGTPSQRYQDAYGRLRAVALEPGGQALWVLTSNCDGRGACGRSKDRVLRVPL